MNKQQMNGYYRQATKMANTLYDYMVDTFEKTPYVVYCVSVERWHNRVSVDVWVNIGNGFAPDEEREQVGCITSGYSFATYTKTKPEDYVDGIKNDANAFFIKAVKFQDKYNNK